MHPPSFLACVVLERNQKKKKKDKRKHTKKGKGPVHRIVTRAASGFIPPDRPLLISLPAWLAHKKRESKNKKGTEAKKRTSPTEKGEGLLQFGGFPCAGS
jgi:hypothetical protein